MGADFELEIDGRGASGTAEYDFAVDGRIDERDGTLNREDEIDGGRASGAVGPGVDRYRIRGEITSFDIDGDATVRVGGRAVAPGEVAGLGHAGLLPNDYRGPGSVAWASGDDGDGGGSGSSGGGDGPSIVERKRKAASDADSQYIDPGDVGVIRTDEDYREAFASIGKDYRGVHAYAVADGRYSPGTIQAAFSQDRGAARIVFCGNYEDPSKVEVTANHNIIHTGKDEHLRFQGMSWSRSQQVGPALYRNMRFPDGFGGKPVGARIQDSYVRDIALYGGGALHIDWGVTLETTREAYVHRANTADVFVHGGTEFASGDRLVTSDRGVRPADLGSGVNRIRFENEL